jgi:hypothetical protein
MSDNEGFDARRLPPVDVEGVIAEYKAKYPSSRPLGHAPWRKDSRTTTLRNDVFAVLTEFVDLWPLGPRQVGYVLMGHYPQWYDKASIDRIENVLNRGRRAWRIPFEAISDGRTPDPTKPVEFDGPSDFWRQVRATAHKFSLLLQAGQLIYVEVWCEVASLIDQVARIAIAMGVPTYSSSGSASLTFCEAAAQRVATRGKAGVQTIIWQIGDHDGKGWEIFDRCRADVTVLAADYEGGYGVVTVERLAVTPEQIVEHRLLDVDGQPVGTIAEARVAEVQGEAIPPDVLATIVTDVIDQWQDPQVRARARESSERARQQVVAEAEALVERYGGR